ncbi:hypothetical protein GCM10010342_47690 [Streptomyces anulatus]|nr:hypothetical protein GCM10010342_47690 [Streptomyces anulatus]
MTVKARPYPSASAAAVRGAGRLSRASDGYRDGREGGRTDAATALAPGIEEAAGQARLVRSRTSGAHRTSVNHSR